MSTRKVKRFQKKIVVSRARCYLSIRETDFLEDGKMNHKTSRFPVSLLTLSLAALASCGGGHATSSQPTQIVPPTTFDGTAYYDSVFERVNKEEGSTLSFDEKLNNGKLDDSLWWILDAYWDAGGQTDWHNGVRSRNVKYIQDGSSTYLGIRGRGNYCQDSDMVSAKQGRIKAEGGVIMSKNFLKPGRFEINMRPMPREGGVTAMWTYYCATGNEETSQNEIDIELGGNGQYTNQWCTTWTTHSMKETQNVDVTKIGYLNDGKFHKFTFDWYTDYQGSGKTWIDWFIDGILIQSIDGDAVPTTAMPLWIGLWLPSWAGNPYFDTDYMIVKEISYVEFDSVSQYCEEARGNPSYSHKTPSEIAPESVPYAETNHIEKLSNANFETIDVAKADNSYFGWKREESSMGNTVLESNGGDHYFTLNAANSTEEYHGEYLGQDVSLLYPGTKAKFKIDAKLKDTASSGNVEISYRKASGKAVGKTEVIPVSSTDWNEISKDLVVPEGASTIHIAITSEEGGVSYNNASLKLA